MVSQDVGAEIGAPTRFIAEVSSNHHRDLQRCLNFIETAAQVGCVGVKFQLFKIRELFAPEVLAQRPDLLERQNWELPVEFLPELAAMCRRVGILFGCTPFYLEAVDELRPHVDFYKVASYELLWGDLLRACGGTGKPVILASGMATLEEVRDAVHTLRKAGCTDLTVLHCVSGYPAPVAECNLAAIANLRDDLQCPVGWSDHSANEGVVFAAVNRWHASVVEFHLDLDGTGDEFKTGHCWLPDDIARVIRGVTDGDRATGTGVKAPVPAERFDREWRADPEDGLRPLAKTRQGYK